MKNSNVAIAWRISLSYALLSSFWIFVSGRLLGIVAPNLQQVTQLATYQAVIFIATTTLLVYTLVLLELWWRPARAFANHAAHPRAGVPATESGTLPLESTPAQVYTDTQRRLVESNSLQRLTAALLQQQTLDDVLPLVCREAQQLTGAGGASLLLLENEAWLRVFHQTGNIVMPALERVPVGNGLAELALLQKKVVLANDPTNFSQLFQPNPELKSLVAIPLLLKDKVIGTLHVLNKPGGFTEDDTRMLSLFADQAAMAIANSRLHEQAKQLAVAQERQLLARELHDSVTQVLYSVILYADATRLALAADKKTEAGENLHELRLLARQAMADMRLLLFRLHPPELEEEGLVAALQARLEAIEARAGLKIDLQAEGENTLPIALEEELYKIAQEALNNVVKHAKAEQVSIHLRFAKEECWMTIQDNGVGFDPATVQGGGGLGLRSIAERVEQIHGQLQLVSSPGQGAKLSVVVRVQQIAARPQAADRLRPVGFRAQNST